MGSWGLEVFKMTLYMSFPVAMFHIFNQPAYFEEWVTKTKRELYPPEALGHRDELQKAIKDMQQKRDNEMMKALEDIEKREKT
ncbi:protein PET100 homolog, mitochondrial [Eurosta solidaginis]|uniref:protein PET100 homolog, mitochondrial n=1 Tax=Eurosta solidaginis TaxID=178769 RepID=UPI003530E832